MYRLILPDCFGFKEGRTYGDQFINDHSLLYPAMVLKSLCFSHSLHVMERKCFYFARPRGRPRTRWRDYVKDLSWSHLGIPPEHLPFVAQDRDARRPQLEQLPPRPPRISRPRKISYVSILNYLGLTSMLQSVEKVCGRGQRCKPNEERRRQFSQVDA